MSSSKPPQPYIVDGSDLSKFGPLERLPLKEGISEAWLQRLLDSVPNLVPITDVDERIDPPITSLGTEIPTASGPIDNLFLSRNGYLIIVETKLWRNPQARREVVAQILDYAVQLRQWDYSTLEKVWRKQKKRDESLWQHIQPDGFEEHEWIDKINENLRQGRMTLLIIGDGIRTEARELGEAVAGHPEFLFCLALIELQVYKLYEERVLVLPTINTKTLEIERAVVTVDYTRLPTPEVTVSTPVHETRDKQPRSILSEEALRKELQSLGPKAAQSIAVVDRLLSLFAKTDFHVEWRSASFTIKVPDPAGSGTLLSLGVVDKSGKFYSYLPWLEEQLKREWQNSEAAARVTQVLSSFLDGLGFRRTGTGKQWSIDLPALSGKEKVLVDGLASITNVIIEEAGKLSPK